MTEPARQDRSQLVLVGELGQAMGVAVEMVRGQEATLSIGHPTDADIDNWNRRSDELVYVDVCIDLPDVITRLRGDASRKPDFARAVAGLVGHNVAEVERELILQTLESCAGNRTSAATQLGISIRTMRNKLRAYIKGADLDAPGILRH